MTIEYIIARTRDSSEWAMTESAGGEHHEIYRSVDNRSMRVVAIFDAPGWEDAKRFFDHLHGSRSIFKDKLSWETVQGLLDEDARLRAPAGE